MTAPLYVPVDPADHPRAYHSEWRRPEPWAPDRPGELEGEEQPRDGLYGNQGPDIGYAMKLVNLLDDKVHLMSGESIEDAKGGAVAVAMRRASIFGRAPILSDLEMAFVLWGFLDEQPDATLVTTRKNYFEGASYHTGYPLLRLIASAVPEETLRLTLSQVYSKHAANWAALLDVS